MERSLDVTRDGAKKIERKASRQRVSGDRVQRITCLRHDGRFEPVGAPDEGDRRTRLQRIGNGDRRIEMTSGTAAGKNDGHRAA